MNKYLEKIATVPHFVKAKRRLAQMFQEGSHDFKSMSVQNTAKALGQGEITPGSWGTHGAGVYAGYKAPAHGYQVSSSSDRLVAFPSQGSQYAIPKNENLRFHKADLPVQDTVIPHAVKVTGRSTYVSLPAGMKLGKRAHPGDVDIARNLEDSIRKSRSRRIYDDDIANELHRRGLRSSAWDSTPGKGVHEPDTSYKRTGEDRVSEITDALKDVRLPQSERNMLLRGTKGDLASIRRATILSSRNTRRRSIRSENKESLHDLALQQLATTPGYEKYIGKV